MPHGRVSSDAGAKQRSGSGTLQIRGNAQDKPLVHNDTVRVAAVGDTTQMFVGKVAGEGHVRAERFESRLAVGRQNSVRLKAVDSLTRSLHTPAP